MPRFQHTQKVNATPEQVWLILGDLSKVDQWIPGITSVRVQGKRERICTFANGAVQHEEISDYSDDTRAYSYHIEGSPLPVKNNRGRFQVQVEGTGARIVWDSEFDALDPAQEAQLVEIWAGAAQGVLQSLVQLVERAEADRRR
ncbi:MAG: SRPBCC family protein [Chloroflexi bacterium]|nr:SRPBCC family protein [Chloroflexota bacterium]